MITRDEAKQLLEATPDVVAARRLGGKISLVDWSPDSASYRTQNFYFYQIFSTKSLPTTPLGNGMFGYYGVNKTAGQVVELNSPNPSVEGPELKSLQAQLRTKHCVGQDLVKTSSLTLER
ncbi:MAG TPA: hypothetical protein VNV25_22380 [Gemmatimonadaceae bacterium]|nr:hypothetical protein [Gemmatimonadaceae bacterium]